MEKNSQCSCSIYKQVLLNDVLFTLNIHKNGSFKKDMKEKYFKLCFLFTNGIETLLPSVKKYF